MGQFCFIEWPLEYNPNNKICNQTMECESHGFIIPIICYSPPNKQALYVKLPPQFMKKPTAQIHEHFPFCC